MALVLTEALGLEQVGLLHADVAAPGQEVGGVVAGEEGTRRSVALARHLPRGKQLKGGKQSHCIGAIWDGKKKYEKVKSHPGPVTDCAARLTLHSADGQLWATLVCSAPMSSQSFTPLFSSSMKNSARTSSPGDGRRGEGDRMTKSAAKRLTRLHFCRSGLLFRPTLFSSS